MIHLPSLLLGDIIAGSLAVSGLAANAQQDTTPTATETDVAIGAYSFTYDQKEPFLAFPVSRTTSGDGAFVTWFAAAELASGTVVGLTPCDDLAVICAPIISPAKAGLARADVGDSVPLAGDGQ